MGELIQRQIAGQPRLSRKSPGKQVPETMGRRLLKIIVYDKSCRIGGKLTVDDLVETSEVGDWKMPDFRLACSFAASQGWLIVVDDTLTLNHGGAGGGLRSANQEAVSRPAEPSARSSYAEVRHQRKNFAVVRRRVHWRRLVCPALRHFARLHKA